MVWYDFLLQSEDMHIRNRRENECELCLVFLSSCVKLTTCPGRDLASASETAAAGCVVPLTHPDFSELSRSELLQQLEGLSGNLPLVLPPGLLWCPRLARLHQLCAQAIGIACIALDTTGRRRQDSDRDPPANQKQLTHNQWLYARR